MFLRRVVTGRERACPFVSLGFLCGQLCSWSHLPRRSPLPEPLSSCPHGGNRGPDVWLCPGPFSCCLMRPRCVLRPLQPRVWAPSCLLQPGAALGASGGPQPGSLTLAPAALRRHALCPSCHISWLSVQPPPAALGSCGPCLRCARAAPVGFGDPAQLSAPAVWAVVLAWLRGRCLQAPCLCFLGAAASCGGRAGVLLPSSAVVADHGCHGLLCCACSQVALGCPGGGGRTRYCAHFTGGRRTPRDPVLRCPGLRMGLGLLGHRPRSWLPLLPLLSVLACFCSAHTATCEGALCF